MEKTRLAVIVGPTASGKTALSVDAAEVLCAEIVSVDSVQIYEKLDIGSAKPTREEMRGIRHHLIGCVPPTCEMSVARYKAMATEAVLDIASRGALPLAVGGTGLYLNALISPLEFTEAKTDQSFRDMWNEMERRSPGCAHTRLQEVDKASADRLHPNDAKRVIRALEVHHLTGRTMSEQNSEFFKKESPYTLSMVGLTMPRELLYSRIEQRVDRMFKDGLADEVRELLACGADPKEPSMQGLGYKETVSYLRGECTLDEAVEKIKRDTRRFAKRQLTWFKRDERIRWLDVTEYTEKELCDTTTEVFRRELNI